MEKMKRARLRRMSGQGLFWIVFAVFCVFINGSAKEADNAVENACRGVVRVLAEEDGTAGHAYGLGSGFGIGRAGEATDIFVTNWHVVTPEEGNEIQAVYILLSNDAVQNKADGSSVFDTSQMLKCEVLYKTDGYPDIAILKAERPVEDHIALPLMRAREAGRGDSIYAIGFPGTSDKANGGAYRYAEIEDVNISTGVISKFFKFEVGGSTWAIQHDAHINHGNSGGPLVTEDGAVIGINTYGFGDNGQEYSVSIFVDYAMQALNELGISYDVYHSGISFADRRIIYLLLAAIAVLLTFAAIAARRKKKSGRGSGNVPEAASVPTPASDGTVWQLQGISGFFEGKKITVNQRVKLGRAVEGNDLKYPADILGISRFHCEIKQENGNVYIRDMSSSYGTYLEERKLPANQWVPMHSGDRFYLADKKECFQMVRTV